MNSFICVFEKVRELIVQLSSVCQEYKFVFLSPSSLLILMVRKTIVRDLLILVCARSHFYLSKFLLDALLFYRNCWYLAIFLIVLHGLVQRQWSLNEIRKFFENIPEIRMSCEEGSMRPLQLSMDRVFPFKECSIRVWSSTLIISCVET